VLIASGAFREDLFYRLNVFPIRVPPLRERAEDILQLVWRLVDEFSNSLGKRIKSIAPDDMLALQRYPWPGNVRELRNVIERAMILDREGALTIPVPRAPALPASTPSSWLIDVERDHIRRVLEDAHWRIRGENGAATRLGLKPTTLESRMAKLGLMRPA
jgi:transcriptional regulator with GAF, ATPase, and Fis domain